MTIKIKIKKIRSPSPRPSPHSMGRGAFFFWALMRNPVGVFGRRDGVAHSENGMYGFYGFWGRVPAGVSLDGRKPVLTRINPDGRGSGKRTASRVQPWDENGLKSTPNWDDSDQPGRGTPLPGFGN